MTDTPGADGVAPDPQVAAVDGEHAAALRQAAAALLGVTVDELPSAADIIASIGGPPPPLTEQQRAQAVGAHRAQAQAEYEQAMTAADAEEARAEETRAHARAMRDKAEEDRAFALANAGRLERGEEPEPPPRPPAAAEPAAEAGASGDGA